MFVLLLPNYNKNSVDFTYKYIVILKHVMDYVTKFYNKCKTVSNYICLCLVDCIK